MTMKYIGTGEENVQSLQSLYNFSLCVVVGYHPGIDSIQSYLCDIAMYCPKYRLVGLLGWCMLLSCDDVNFTYGVFSVTFETYGKSFEFYNANTV